MFTGVDSAINYYYYYYYYYYYVVLLYLISMHLKKLISLLLKVHKYSRRDETERSAIYIHFWDERLELFGLKIGWDLALCPFPHSLCP
jgi:hypothetical protein